MAEITAAEIRGLTRHWPDRAKASIGYTTANGGGWVQTDGTDLSPWLAAELQAMAGLRWLIANRPVEVVKTRMDTALWIGLKRYSGPYLLHAVSQAVMDAHAGPIQTTAIDLTDPDITTCPNCGGPADNGFTREIPPSPYYCSKCEFSPRP